MLAERGRLANPVGIARVLPLPSPPIPGSSFSTATSGTEKPLGPHLMGTSSLWAWEEGREAQT